MRLRATERWIAVVRLAAVPFTLFQVAVSDAYPPGYETWAWVTTAVLAVGAVALWVVARRELVGRASQLLSATALSFDFAIVSAFVLVYHFESGTPTRQLLFLPLTEGALRYGMPGAVAIAVASLPVAALFERLRSNRFGDGFHTEFVSFQLGVELLLALIVGWLVHRLDTEMEATQARVVEAEELRDQLGRRADLLDAANRCARAIGSSLDMDEAFAAFTRELRGLVPFDRAAIVLAENGAARVLAATGDASETVLSAGDVLPSGHGLMDEVVAGGQTVYRSDLTHAAEDGERRLAEAGLRSRVVAPLLLGARAIGILTLSRRERDAFEESEIELVSLLGRLVATAVQNTRAYETERHTVEELRRLSTLRSDFVSLVSHELRSPMAAVIGSARTLQGRWRELSPQQRESFLALIADETSRLAALVGDVLDTSRIDGGSFSYSFAEVDVAALVDDSTTAAGMAQDEVPVVARVIGELPRVRGDRERLRQVLVNLIDNAVKYSPHGEQVDVEATGLDDRVLVSVADRGPGIAVQDQRLVFEKFGRAVNGASKPGTGLGLYIARSIAEAHGGTLELRSSAGRGTTFVLSLPVER